MSRVGGARRRDWDHGRSASILIQSGFNSCLAAIKAVNDSGAMFTTRRELREWLRSARVIALLIQADWSSPETAVLA
jgi:hypothetical protein